MSRALKHRDARVDVRFPADVIMGAAADSMDGFSADAVDRRYAAFISYSRANDAAARSLHKRLESFVLPASLRRVSPGVYRDARPLRPIFLDQEEFVPGSDLGAKIRSALVGSQYLILLASPASASSPWVNLEVETFLRLGRADRIIVLVHDGEPNAVASGKPSGMECLPPALLSTIRHEGSARLEPLWLDWRGKAARERKNLIRLVAALLSLRSMDDLVRRDLQARRYRLVLRAAAAVLLVLGFAGAVGTWQFYRTSIAAQAKQEFEKIASSMDGDAVTTSQQLGRLESSIGLFVSLIGRGGDDEQRVTLAKMFVVLSDISLQMNEKRRARQALENARGEIRGITADAFDRRDVAEIAVRINNLEAQILLFEDKLEYADKFLAQSQNIIAEQLRRRPRDASFHFLLAVKYFLSADVNVARGNWRLAHKHYVLASATFRSLARAVRANRGLSLKYLSQARKADFASAVQEQLLGRVRSAVGAMRGLQSQSGGGADWSRDALSDRLFLANSLGDGLVDLGYLREAEILYRLARSRTLEVMVRSPDRPDLLNSFTLSSLWVADALIQLGAYGDARPFVDDATSIVESFKSSGKSELVADAVISLAEIRADFSTATEGLHLAKVNTSAFMRVADAAFRTSGANPLIAMRAAIARQKLALLHARSGEEAAAAALLLEADAMLRGVLKVPRESPYVWSHALSIRLDRALIMPPSPERAELLKDVCAQFAELAKVSEPGPWFEVDQALAAAELAEIFRGVSSAREQVLAREWAQRARGILERYADYSGLKLEWRSRLDRAGALLRGLS